MSTSEWQASTDRIGTDPVDDDEDDDDLTNRLMPISGVKREERDEQIGLIYTTAEVIDLKDCLNDDATKRLIQRKSETTKNKLLLQIILPANERKKKVS